MSTQLNEIFDLCAAGKTKDERRHLFTQWVNKDKTIPFFLKMAFDPEFKITGIPEGIPHAPLGRPPYLDKDIPPGMGFTTLRVEARRLMNFCPKGTMQSLTKDRREFLWARAIEGFQWQEILLLTAIKDGQLAVMYPFLLEVLDIVGMKIADPAEPKAPKKKKADK